MAIGKNPVVEGEASIRGDFYTGAYGPTVLLKLISVDAAHVLHTMFLRLAEGEPTISLYPNAAISIQHLDQIDLRLVPAPPDKHFRQTGARPAFVWEATAEEWTAMADLLQPFLHGDTGHQYLTSETADDALVTVSLGENYPNL